jgi:nucleotide-binding universal stress UspA family protein
MYIEKICVATDGSDLAVHAARIAVLLARTGAGRFLAFSVAQPHFSMAELTGRGPSWPPAPPVRA